MVFSSLCVFENHILPTIYAVFLMH